MSNIESIDMPIVRIPYEGNEKVNLLKLLTIFIDHGCIPFLSIPDYRELFWQQKDIVISINESVEEFIRRDLASYGSDLRYHIE